MLIPILSARHDRALFCCVLFLALLILCSPFFLTGEMMSIQLCCFYLPEVAGIPVPSLFPVHSYVCPNKSSKGVLIISVVCALNIDRLFGRFMLASKLSEKIPHPVP